jgi:hypothetical protein
VVVFRDFRGAGRPLAAPDNFREYRVATVAHRTSPTNMGLALLSNLAACDFGYIAGGALVERTANTLGTMEQLARYRGHFYNWYDTLTLQPMPPLYVSPADSGNLAGHLLTLGAGLLAWPMRRSCRPGCSMAWTTPSACSPRPWAVRPTAGWRRFGRRSRRRAAPPASLPGLAAAFAVLARSAAAVQDGIGAALQGEDPQGEAGAGPGAGPAAAQGRRMSSSGWHRGCCWPSRRPGSAASRPSSPAAGLPTLRAWPASMGRYARGSGPASMTRRPRPGAPGWKPFCAALPKAAPVPVTA